MSRRLTCPRGHIWMGDVPIHTGDSTQVLPNCPFCGEVGAWLPGDEPRAADVPTSRVLDEQVKTGGADAEPALTSPPTLPGLELQGELGRGGMGIVYRGLDLKRGGEVAVKVLPRMDPASLLRFKHEFRSLAGLSHPNLATLYELIADDNRWYILMELVEGLPFTNHFANIADRKERIDQFRPAFRQLVEAVHYLHQMGLLHCDLKPSNVLINPQGRVTLLDFGLVQPWQAPPGKERRELIGSLGYIAPERFAGRPHTRASDWYSVGVIAYETLVGKRPFEGEADQLIWQYQHMDATPPRERQGDIPEVWNALCVALLQRDAAKRPEALEILRRLGYEPALPPAIAATPRHEDVPLVGRDLHLHELQQVFATVRNGRPAVVQIRGRSGMGKTALAERFLERVAERERAVILRGRCYEQESVPFKGMDSLVDALSHQLAGLPEDELATLVPEEMGALARAFPVLRRLKLGAKGWKSADVTDPVETRRRAFASLRELLTQLARHGPLVLFLDDLQWADADSVRLLLDLVRPPEAAPVLLLLSYRTEQEQENACLRALRETLPPADSTVVLTQIAVEPLTPLEASSLALMLLADSEAGREEVAAALARESQGWPLYVHELARQVRLLPQPMAGGLSLDQMIWQRLQQLPSAERRLLEVLAVAGQPLRQSVAFQSAEVEAEPHGVFAMLRNGHWIRAQAVDAEAQLECLHDSIRETVLRHLPPAAQAAHHERLLRAYSAAPGAPRELLAWHCLSAGRPDEAAEYYGEAARQAAEALAFERAAHLYRLCLDLHPPTAAEASAARERLATYLALAGRGLESAQAYLAACQDADQTRIFQLRRQAAYQFCASGQVDLGLDTLREVLRTAGLTMPASPQWANLALLWYRTRLRARGLDVEERGVQSIPAEKLERIDLCWAATAGMSLFDIVSGAYFQARHLEFALNAGEPFRLARALAWEACHRSSEGSSAAVETEKYLGLARELAARVINPHAQALVAMAEGIVAHNLGRWPAARQWLAAAETLFRTRCTGVAWERDTTHAFLFWTLSQLGEFAAMEQLAARLLKEARDRGNLFAATNIATFAFPQCRLVAGDTAGAREVIHEQMSEWSRSGFHLQHMTALWSECRLDWYEGNVAAAWHRLEERWPALSAAKLFRVQVIRVPLHQLRGALALAMCRKEGSLRLLPWALRAERDLEQEDGPWASALAAGLRPGIAACQGKADDVKDLLRLALQRYEDVAMNTYAAAVRWTLGEMPIGDETRDQRQRAEAWMRAQGVADPTRLAKIHVPGVN
ncbi:MAG TPA: protein kinase [Gemmataceae bacterium]|nr:protein kinase [Gemmataceae bacterium]